MVWNIKKVKGAKTPRSRKKSLLLVGLPGIGNVGKITIDYLLNTLKARPLLSFFSSYLPASVMVNEDSLLQMPGLSLAYAQTKTHTLYFLHGDMQPIDDFSSHEFAKTLIQWVKKQGIQQMLTVGGIGLKELPEQPRIFVTAAEKKIITQLKKQEPSLQTDLYGYVGPIIGLVGLLPLYAYQQRISAATLLVEASNHPLSLNIRSVKKLLSFFSSYCHLSLDLSSLDKEVSLVEEEVIRQLQGTKNQQQKKDINYIG